jgi:hypothetical protein
MMKFREMQAGRLRYRAEPGQSRRAAADRESRTKGHEKDAQDNKGRIETYSPPKRILPALLIFAGFTKLAPTNYQILSTLNDENGP